MIIDDYAITLFFPQKYFQKISLFFFFFVIKVTLNYEQYENTAILYSYGIYNKRLFCKKLFEKKFVKTGTFSDFSFNRGTYRLTEFMIHSANNFFAVSHEYTVACFFQFFSCVRIRFGKFFVRFFKYTFITS